MKKLLVYLLAAAMVLSFGFNSVTALSLSQNGSRVGDDVIAANLNITTETNIGTCGNGTHSGHQTRIVHTSHGDYVAYVTKQQTNVNEFSIIKIDNGTATVLYQEYVSYDSSSISIFADENENVYAATLVSNKWGSLSGANVAIWAVNSATDKVTGYTANIPFAKSASGGYGYAQPVINGDKIYAIFSGGDAPNGVISWFTFDLNSKKWEPEAHYIDIDSRHCYHYAFAYKNGIALVTQRDILAAALGYPEVTRSGGNNVWPADYVWDQEDLYLITDMNTNNSFTAFSVAEADYSGVGEDRTSLEARKTNLYPANKVYDTYLDGNELHVLGDTRYYRGGFDRKNTEGHVWHRVFDVSSSTPRLLSNEELTAFEGYEISPKAGYFISNDYTPRFARAEDGTFYIVGMRSENSLTVKTGMEDDGENNYDEVPNGVKGKLQLLRVEGSSGSGYEYSRVYVSSDTYDMNGGDLCVANARSLSVEDQTISIVYADKSKNLHYLSLDLTSLPESEVLVAEANPFTEASIEQSLKDQGITTPAIIKTKMQEALQVSVSDGELTAENFVLYDVTVKVESADGTQREATEDDFTNNGGRLRVRLPYPDGTGKDTHTFTVLHMIDKGWNGKAIGSIEVVPATNMKDGIEFDITGLSPFGIYWEEKEIIPKPPVITTPVGAGGGTDNDVSTTDNFWRDVADEIRGSKDGDTVRVDAGNRTTVSSIVFRAMRENPGVTLVIQWDGGSRITIPAGKAPNEPGRITYSLSSLSKMEFSSNSGVATPVTPSNGSFNPNTGAL